MAQQIERDRAADADKIQQERKRLAFADVMEPIDWQASQKVDGELALVQVAKQTTDDKGRVGAPLRRRRSPIEAMLARGTIRDVHYAAGVQFATAFANSGYETLKACDLMRTGGGQWSAPAEYQMIARETVWGVIDRLGGIGSLTAKAAWNVIGQDMSIKDFCATTRISGDRRLDKSSAAGVVMAALDCMAGFFKLPDPDGCKVESRAEFRAVRQDVDWLLPQTATGGV